MIYIPPIFYPITGLINAVSAISLGFLVYSRDRKSATNLTFSFFCLAAAVWSLFYFFWQIAKTPDLALLFSRGLMMGAIFIPISHFHFIITFLNQRAKRNKALVFGYLLSVFFFLANFTPFFVRNVEPKLSFSFWPTPGVFYHPFLLVFFLYTIYAWSLLFRAHKNSLGIRKQQIKYVLLGSMVSFIGGSTNYFLWYNIPIPPIGNVVAVTFIVFIAYAIFKHHLFNIKVIATELFAAALILVLFINVVASTSPSRMAANIFIFISGAIFGVLLIRSVLKEVETRKRLREAYEELKRADKAKSEFLSMASHQLRTPLTSIKGYISMMLEGDYGKIGGKQKGVLNNIFHSNERLIKIVNDLLNISRIELGKIEVQKEKIRLGDLIESCYQEMKEEALKKGLEFIFKKPKVPLPRLNVDQLKIRQVILNLLDNAIRYTRRGKIEIELKRKKEALQILVRDTGEGLSEDEEKEIFSSFARGTAGVNLFIEGSGLGLYVAKKYLDLHQGKIWAESPGRGKGSTFYVELPLK